MRTRYLLGVIAVLLLILSVWLVPMALAAADGSTSPEGWATPAQPSGTQCPFLQTHPWLDPHGADSGASTGTTSEVMYY